jgi:hypothetical protein
LRAPFAGIDQYELIARGYVGVQFVRGFVSVVTCTWADWSRHADALLAACPIAHSRDGCVRLTDWPNEREEPSRDILTAYDVVFKDGVRVPGLRAGRDWDTFSDILPAALNRRWPGVKFHLPDADEAHDLTDAITDAMNRHLAAGLGTGRRTAIRSQVRRSP